MSFSAVRFAHSPRHHVGIIALLPMLALGVLILWFVRDQWMGWPTPTANWMLFPFLFAGPVIAALQTIESARIEEARVDNWVRRSLRVRVRENTRSLTVSWILVVVLAGVWGVGTWWVSRANSVVEASTSFLPAVGYTALGFFAVGFGHLCGKLTLKTSYLAITAFVGVLIAAMYATQYLNYEPYQLIPRGAIIVLIVTAGLLNIVAVVVPVGARSSTAWQNGVPLAVGVTSLIAVLVVAYLEIIPPVRQDADPICSKGSPTICVWHEHKNALDNLEVIRERVASQLPENLSVPTHLDQYGLTESRDVGESLNFGHGAVDSTLELAAAYILAITNSQYADHVNSEEGAHARTQLESWLILSAVSDANESEWSRLGMDPSTMREVSQLTSLSVEEQRKWVDRTYDASIRDLEP